MPPTWVALIALGLRSANALLQQFAGGSFLGSVPIIPVTRSELPHPTSYFLFRINIALMDKSIQIPYTVLNVTSRAAPGGMSFRKSLVPSIRSHTMKIIRPLAFFLMMACPLAVIFSGLMPPENLKGMFTILSLGLSVLSVGLYASTYRSDATEGSESQVAVAGTEAHAKFPSSNSALNSLLRLIAKLRSFEELQLFTIYTRYLIGGAFVIAAFNMGKFSGPWSPGFSPEFLELTQRKGIEIEPFDNLDAFGQFWRAMGTSGMYWKFIGAGQVVGGALLMTQRLARLGAVIFFAIILNIFVITVTYQFVGTPYITGLMLLAVTYLLVWDLDALQPLYRSASRIQPVTPESGWIASPYWCWLGAVMMAAVISEYFLRINMVFQLLTAFFIGAIGLVIFLVGLSQKRKRFLPAPLDTILPR